MDLLAPPEFRMPRPCSGTVSGSVRPRLQDPVSHDFPPPEALPGAAGQTSPGVPRPGTDPTDCIRNELPRGAGQSRETPLAAE